MAAAPAGLKAKAEEFARELTDTFAGVLGPDVPRFVAEVGRQGRRQPTRVAVHTEDSVTIPLHIDEVHALTMVCWFQCTWDSQQAFLKVREAKVEVQPVGHATPLFRYEFEAEKSDRLPCAHLHVHAHRDQFLYTMVRAENGKAGVRRAATLGVPKAGAPPQLSDVHFPLGGPRMRPCVEDVLHMLVSEFAIDTVPDAAAVIEEGRARWRRRQAAAIVRDAPGEAVRVLRDMGYKVSPPDDGEASERIASLVRF